MELDTLWSEFDMNIIKEKPITTKAKLHFMCEYCNIPKVFGYDNLPTCTGCGRVDSYYLDDSPEWISGVGEDGKVTDASRCVMPTDLDLFSEKWGSGTIISNKGANYAMRRMAMINFHSSMNHKDRSLFHAYNDIEEAAKNKLGLPDNIVKTAKILYRKFNGMKLTRGAVRTGIKANCVFYACKAEAASRTTKEIADAFGIPTRDISRTSDIFKEIVSPAKTQTQAVIRSNDVIHRLLNLFEVKDKRAERMKCLKFAAELEKCVALMGKTPTSIASVVILKIIGAPKQEICEKCEISLPTLNKIELIANNYLEGKIQ
jgi:transcription initiation factor TFIIIB Brf1 subunit/transcription initiation factor TFIIB